MPRWSAEFRNRLENDTVYAPQFRLVIGSPAITTKLGEWESDKPKILEIASHPNTSSFSGVTGSHGTGFFRGAPVTFLVGLTDRITCGQQSITPRKFQYTGMTMSAEVTPHAAERAMQLPIGTLSKLQMRLVGHSEAGGPTDFETIHIGSFRGVQWNGQRYILNFSDALQAAEQRITDDGSYTSSPVYNWFEGIGTELTAGDALTTFDGTVDLPLTFATDFEHPSRIGHAYKKPTSFGGLAYHYGRPIMPTPGIGRAHNIWAEVQNTDNNPTYILFADLFPGDPMRLFRAQSNGVSRLPGRQDGDDVAGGIAAGSVIKQVCVIHGTPVTEIVNTIYTMGYHEQMVCGLFGETVDEASEALNVHDIEKMHKEFNDAWVGETGVDAATGSTSSTSTGTVPMIAPIAEATASGATLIKKLCAKYAVFPRFKEGGYSVGVCGRSIYDSTLRGDRTLITQSDVESVEWEQIDPQTIGDYASLTFSNSDHADDKPTPTSIGFNVDGALPILAQLTVNTSDVAPGATLGNKYQDWFHRNVFREWFLLRREKVTMRLCGFRFAHLAPGDRVDVFLGDASPGKGYGYGPSDPVPERGDHIVNSITSVDEEQRGSYTVLSVKVDWIGIKVHVTLSRQVGTRIDSRFSPIRNGRLTQELGTPQRDIDPDL